VLATIKKLYDLIRSYANCKYAKIHKNKKKAVSQKTAFDYSTQSTPQLPTEKQSHSYHQNGNFVRYLFAT